MVRSLYRLDFGLSDHNLNGDSGFMQRILQKLQLHGAPPILKRFVPHSVTPDARVYFLVIPAGQVFDVQR